MDSIVKRHLIAKALRRSYVKRKIINYLSIYECGYISEIARYISCTPTNVCGAVRGMQNRYNTGDSLVGLNLVEEIDTGRKDKLRFYRITPLGRESIEMCREVDYYANKK
jgi:predicted transcriptional regulator with HTH domain